MNYQESIKILEEIRKADKILLNCHRGPDPDGIGSTLAMKLVLAGMSKKVSVICPTKAISKQTEYLKGYKEIKLGVSYDTFDFSKYDLFITLDTPNFSLLTGGDSEKMPDVKTVVIDHHHLSTLKGFITVLDEGATSVGEILYRIFEDWGISLSKDIAECLLTSIIGDTGAFAYPNVTPETLSIAAELMSLGADKNMIADRIYRTEEFDMLKFWSAVLSKMEIDKDHRFVYSFMSFDEYKKFKSLDDAKAKAASLFAPIVEDTDFGFIGIEEKPKCMTVSFRGRTDFDTSQIAKDLGGGGHKVASATKIEGLLFEDAVDRVLTAARKYARKNY
jgi:phosphoesterase RecJ-like protein